MPAEKLFWDSPYLTRCDATVTWADGGQVTLDRTVAFAFSGGQASDVGTIGGHEILIAENQALEIVYTLPDGHGLVAGDTVAVQIDADIRARLRRLHFAAELVLELVTKMFDGPEKIGANITAEKARVDFVWDGNIADTFDRLQPELAWLVAADMPIVSDFSDRETQCRFWRIEGFAQVPCGGTHPASTGEVGELSLKRTNPGSGKERIEIQLVR